jgi:hypothetical protein
LIFATSNETKTLGLPKQKSFGFQTWNCTFNYWNLEQKACLNRMDQNMYMHGQVCTMWTSKQNRYHITLRSDYYNKGGEEKHLTSVLEQGAIS